MVQAPPLLEKSSQGLLCFDRFTNDCFELPLVWVVTELIEGKKAVRHLHTSHYAFTAFGVEPHTRYGQPAGTLFVYGVHRPGRGELSWRELNEIATEFPAGLRCVPPIGLMDRRSAVEYCLQGFVSHAATDPIFAAGIVARTSPDLFDRRGNKLWWQLRTADRMLLDRNPTKKRMSKKHEQARDDSAGWGIRVPGIADPGSGG